MKKFELFICSLGNGLTVCNKAIEENGDYKTIAHISNAGNIKWYVSPGNVPGGALLNIEHQADVMFHRFKDSFEALPEIQQYQRIMDNLSLSAFLEACKDKRPISEKLPELRMNYYKIA